VPVDEDRAGNLAGFVAVAMQQTTFGSQYGAMGRLLAKLQCSREQEPRQGAARAPVLASVGCSSRVEA
jgi:hypothetical protein